MTRWSEFREQQPEMAAIVERLFATGRHKTIATVRSDGAPRISGIECEFGDDLTFGSMPEARKIDDLRRDPRFAVHSPSIDPVEGDEAAWPGEAKISGRATSAGPLVGDDRPSGELFVADIESVVVTRLNADATKLVVEWWTPDGGCRRIERA